MTTPCIHCKTTIRHTDTTGCCSACGRVFVGLDMFDRHQWTDGEAHGCHDPATMRTKTGRPLMELVDRTGGQAWRRHRPDQTNPWVESA